MELERFMEEDIVAFLDKKLREQPATAAKEQAPAVAPEEAGLYAPKKDYEKEFDAAVKEENMSKAKHLLHELKEKADSFPENSPEMKEHHRLLEKLYPRFQKVFGHAAEEETVKDLTAELAAFTPAQSTQPIDETTASPLEEEPQNAPHMPEETPEIPPEKAPVPQQTPEAMATPEPEPRPAPEPTPQLTPQPVPTPEPRALEPQPATTPKHQGPSDEEEQHLEADLAQIETLIAEKELSDAARLYHHVKNNLHIELLNETQRTHILRRMKQFYKAIHEPMEEPKASSEETHRLINEHIEAARLAAENKMRAEAMRQYQHARNLLARLPAREQKGAKSELHTLYGQIENMQKEQPQNILDDEEQQLRGKP